MERVSELKIACSKFSITIERPSVINSTLLSSPWLAGPITKRCNPYPRPKKTIAMGAIATYGSIPA